MVRTNTHEPTLRAYPVAVMTQSVHKIHPALAKHLISTKTCITFTFIVELFVLKKEIGFNCNSDAYCSN